MSLAFLAGADPTDMNEGQQAKPGNVKQCKSVVNGVSEVKSMLGKPKLNKTQDRNRISGILAQIHTDSK